VFAECSRSPTPSDPIAIRIPRARSAGARAQTQLKSEVQHKRSKTPEPDHGVADHLTPHRGRHPSYARGHMYTLSRSAHRRGAARAGTDHTTLAVRTDTTCTRTRLRSRVARVRRDRNGHDTGPRRRRAETDGRGQAQVDAATWPSTQQRTSSGAPHLLGVSAGCCCCWRRSGPTRAAVAAASGLAPP
jgi:hypothetical protein